MINLGKFEAGHFENGSSHKYFVPNLVNDYWSWDDPQINNLLEKAAIKLGELNSYGKLVPSIDLFLQLHVTNEAVLSSKIEGTQTHLDEAFLTEEEVSPERRDDWKEVINYINALNTAVDTLKEIPISSRLIKQTHSILLSNVRGENKLPGEFRTSQNWIGGTTPSDAVFVPPTHLLVNPLMGDLENFLHNEEIDVPALVRIAIAHYQFETIHPFLDGNGRIGRLLIPLYLIDQEKLAKPLLYLSNYFEKNKTLYYDNLMFVRTKNDMAQWIKYFLVGIETTAQRAIDTLSNVLSLKSDLESIINKAFGKKAHSAHALLQALFKKPICNVRDVQEILSISYKSANSLINDFIHEGILNEFTDNIRYRRFAFNAYLKLFM